MEGSEKRLWIAIILSVIILVAWQIIFPVPSAPPGDTEGTDALFSDTDVPSETADSTTLAAPERSAPAVSPASPEGPLTTPLEIDTALLPVSGGSDTPITASDTSHGISWSVSPRGGCLIRYDLLEYRRDMSDLPVEMVGSPNDSSPRLFPFDLLLTVGDERISSVTAAVETGPETVRLIMSPSSGGLPPGILIEKFIRFIPEEHRAELTISLINPSSSPMLASSARLSFPEKEISRSGSLLLHLGPDLGRNETDNLYSTQFAQIHAVVGRGTKIERPALKPSFWHSIFGAPDPPLDADWAAIENQYFVMAWRPGWGKMDLAFDLNEEGALDAYTLLPTADIAPGDSVSYSFDFFIGPKETVVLESFDPFLVPLDGMEPRIFPHSISFARWMVSILRFLTSITGNYGVSIIILTVGVKLILFPLSAYSMKSMARMQELKPRIEAIQMQYKDDKERQQRETMNLYREAGVNPLGGCLPMIIQIPILFGLFSALRSATELRGEPFAFWIGDLSIPDTIAFIGTIPVNPLPIAMIGSMLLQQKMTPNPAADPQQKQMMTIMMVVMGVLFYNLPSGLTLYWTLQNILSILQQYLINRERAAERMAQADKEERV